ncbi:MAG: tRNA (adenosine(37)-N6)-dimethylallyltransferase MiaA [Candidatus Paceibacterota bacterium]|jgi:tRNA dimethylallyltransferase
MNKNPVKPKILIILGPTATGKSDLAVSLAKKCNGEVISADSRQVYRGMDIGTGKVTKKEMGGIPHHLLDVADPRRQFTVAKFVKLAEKAIKQITNKGKLPIICGGTGFYIQALVDGIIIPEVPANNTLRKKLSKMPVTDLFKMLSKLDPERAKNIDSKNPRRLIRAIEVATALGKVPPLNKNVNKYDATFIGLNLPPEELKMRIQTRLLKRLKHGMLNESRKLHVNGISWKRMEDFGLEYRYIARHLQGKISKEEMVKQLDMEIWHYAKRQMTWFKKEKRIKWFRPDEYKKIEEMVK